MKYLIRSVEADEWRDLKELRLAALADPVARIAFNDTYEKAAAYPDDVWRDRAKRSADEDGIATFVGEDAGGGLVGMVVVLLELDGDLPRTHLVGVYMRPEHRGTGLARELFQRSIDWSWALDDPRVDHVRLWVHEENIRAEAFYGRIGFVRTGRSMPDPKTAGTIEYEMALARP